MEYDWDLQAALAGDGRTDDPYPALDPFGVHEFQQQEDFLLSDNFGETSGDFDQMEGLYQSFHPVFSQTIVTESMSVPQDLEMKAEKLKSLQSLSDQPPPDFHASRPKKIRKNQQKRVVRYVKEDGLQSDAWAWRKYGQKPIKGSPYPRSYYRCSSLKGCLARKQVERSCSDPNTFIITYTAEHSHSEPTRRSSLAGSKRNKAKAPLAMEQERKEVGALEGGQKLEGAIMSKEQVESLEHLEALLMDQAFLDDSPEFWPMEDFSNLIGGDC